jgi:hypothetical protein
VAILSSVFLRCRPHQFVCEERHQGRINGCVVAEVLLASEMCQYPSEYAPIRYSERLAEADIEPSVGSKGDSYANPLAETINGQFKAELIHRPAPQERPRSQSNWQRLNGSRGSITTGCWSPIGYLLPVHHTSLT